MYQQKGDIGIEDDNDELDMFYLLFGELRKSILLSCPSMAKVILF